MPAEEYRAHDYVAGGLMQIESIHSVKLVSRVYNERIGNSASNRVYIFFPDMHLINRQRRKSTNWSGFNHEKMFVDILKKLIELRKAATGILFHVYQLGDFVDLWRIEGDDPSSVLHDYAFVTWYLFRGGSADSVDARFVLGNHDTRLGLYPPLSTRWHTRLFFPTQSEPAVYVTHGDIFDPLEKSMPDDLKEFFVYISTGNVLEDIFGGGDKARILGELKEIREKTCRDIGEDATAKIGGPKPLMISRDLNDAENVKSKHKFLEPCIDRIRSFPTNKLNAAVIGHTHRAAIAVDDRTGFTLMDVGAWTGDYAAGGGIELPCCQMGVVCGNDFRIYQLDPDTSLSKRFEDSPIA